MPSPLRPKKVMSPQQWGDMVHEAEMMEDLLRHPGWALLDKEMKSQATKIQTVLLNNTLNTYEETTVGRDGSKTIITTRETQVGENVGMYKEIKYLKRFIQAVISGPAKALEMERQGIIGIEKVEIKDRKGVN